MHPRLLQLGTWVSTFDEPRMRRAAEAVRRALPGSNVSYYRAKIPFSTSLQRPKNPEKVKKGANYIAVEWKGIPMVELFGTRLRAAGRIDEEKIPEKHYDKIVDILGDHRIYTFSSFKHKNPRIRFSLMGMAFFITMLSILLAIPAFQFWIVDIEILSMAGLLFGIGMMFAYAK